MTVDTLLATLEQAANGEAERLLASAQAEAERLLREAEVAAEHRRALALDEARSRARKRSDRAVAEAGRALQERLLTRRTTTVERILGRAGARLETLALTAYVDRLEALVRTTLAYLAGAPATLVCRPDAADAVRAVAAGTDAVRVEVDPAASAGVLGRSVDGRVTIDNTLPSLLQRRRPGLAIAIARRIEEPSDAVG